MAHENAMNTANKKIPTSLLTPKPLFDIPTEYLPLISNAKETPALLLCIPPTRDYQSVARSPFLQKIGPVTVPSLTLQMNGQPNRLISLAQCAGKIGNFAAIIEPKTEQNKCL
jgi:hypothetical protein